MPALYTPFDVALKDAVVLRFHNGPNVQFQFPPKITNDSRKGTWQENDQTSGTEPVAEFKTSGAREITLAWTYIVDGGNWTTDKIAEQIKNVRGYFARVRGTTGINTRDNLIVFLKMWNFGGPNAASCRIRNIDVKYSETLVTHCTGSGSTNVNKAFALRSDITLDLRLWTKGGNLQVQDLTNLDPREVPQWY